MRYIIISVLFFFSTPVLFGSELGAVHDAGWLKLTANLNKQSEINWVVQLHKKNKYSNDRGFRSWIKTFGGDQKIQMTKDLSIPINNFKKIPDNSPLHDLVVLRASLQDIQNLLKSGKIVRAEPDRKYELYRSRNPILIRPPKIQPMPYYLPFTMNDLLWPNQWGLQQSGFNQIRQNFSSTVTQTASRALIFIIDSWIDTHHEDFNSNNFINSPGPFADAGLPPYHGTHVAGIISANSNNHLGIAGALNSATIVPIKVCSNNNYCDVSEIVQAIYFAADGLPDTHLPRVVNMSLGAPSFSYQMFDAIKYAQSKDVLIVAAAGNSASPALGFYPAAYPDVISVGASAQDGGITYFSNYGQNSLTLLAPGEHIASSIPAASANANDPYAPTLINNLPYAYLDGTSMAAPFVTAASAMLRANQQALPQYQIRQILQQSAQETTINTYAQGEVYKILDAESALRMDLLATPHARAAHPVTASATLDMTKSCYVKYNPKIACNSNCIVVHGTIGHLSTPKTRIRWMVFQQLPTEPEPWWTTAVNSDGTFDDQIYYKLPEFDNDGQAILNNYNFLIGFIEDRDESGEIRNLIPLKYYNGQDFSNVAFDIGRANLCH